MTCNGQALGNVLAIVKDHKPIAKATATGQPEAMEMDLRVALCHRATSAYVMTIRSI
ncbi:hypothetical protein [Tardiphaga sp. OK246]|uniref:hypothetical protein n=1 Tax=Tardiphaga sp. OK246 TaxID=1855307 RepID=UPI0015963180|nr:hypothetical protein [Tardiphaga sp. OK246]